ncbi:MAG: peptidoglycan DD-metalloendopeptidase family protein [Ruthenibacterium lactatiformans]
MAIFKGRVRVRYGYSRWGYTRNNGKGWHGGSDEEGLDSTTIRMPDYKGKSISGRVVTARKVDRSTGSKTWEWGWYVCVELDAGQTPDAVNCLYFCHNARNLVSVGQRVKSGDALAVMGSTGNASLASPPFAHCHFEVRATAAGAGLDPTAYTGHPNAVGTYGEAIDETEDSDMKFLEVTSGKCEVFTAPDVNAVDKHYNGGKLTEGVCYPVQAEVGSSGGYSWVRIFVAGVQRYAAVLADRCRLVTLSPGDAFAACVAQGGDAAGQRAQRDGRAGGRVRAAHGGIRHRAGGVGAMESIIVALITGVLSLVGVVITNTAAARRTENKITTAQAVTDTKLDELTREVREHNGFARRMPVVEEQIKVANHRISDLEKWMEGKRQ